MNKTYIFCCVKLLNFWDHLVIILTYADYITNNVGRS